MKVDNPFKSKLYQHTLPVRDDLWTAIEKQLPPQEKERVFPFFWLILFASTLFSGALMFGILNRSKTPPPNAANAPAYTLTTPSTSTSSTPGTTATPSDLNANTIPSDITSTSASTLSEHPSSPAPQTLKHTLTSSYHKTLSQKDEAASEQTASSASASTSGLALASSSTSASAWTTAELPYFGFENLQVATRHKPMMKKIKPDPSCYKFSGVTGRYELSVDAFAGPGFSPRSFTESGPESSIYMQARKSTESNQYAWAAGARLNLLLHNGVAFRLGLMYDQAGDVFDYTDTLATQSTTRIDSFFAADGTFLY
ncbi:MAG TPA: hypothetical protein VJ508_01525, partial [Saprospiraceae bacterium]|nr:hypothetical protein [Saprospiraceae bacterium]